MTEGRLESWFVVFVFFLRGEGGKNNQKIKVDLLQNQKNQNRKPVPYNLPTNQLPNNPTY